MTTLLVAIACSAMPAASAGDPAIDLDQATAFAKLALAGIQKEYPNKPGHVLAGPQDVLSPRELHPAFYGCYDWHSAVHGHWMLVRLLRVTPDLPQAAEIRAVLNRHLTEANLQGELRYFQRPESASFERPYGWAWLFKLAEELRGWDDADARRWWNAVEPLANEIETRFLDYFPKQTYPTRSGVHSNTAFGLAFAHDYARAAARGKLKMLVEERAKTYFLKDRSVPAAWEPGGADFFSPSLMESALMRRVLPAGDFARWWGTFLPEAAQGGPASLLKPATVTDRSDPQLVHLDGLNLSRAWCMKSIVASLPAGDLSRAHLEAAWREHAAAALPHVASGEYAGEHWLASFAVYLLTETSP